MAVLLWIFAALAALCLLYLFLIAPCKSRPDASALEGWRYAHRGLHDGNHAVPENSLAAFERAVEAGFGMELDVQLTADKRLVVHHDGSLKRVCGVDRLIRDLTYEELCRIPLPDGSRVPLFGEVLALVDGRAPIIVEVKHHGGAAANAAAAWEHLKDYAGPYCVESFNPLAMRWFRRHAPHVLRGQLVYSGRWQPDEVDAVSHFMLKHQLVNCVSRPHFVACSYPQDHTLAMRLMKRLFHPLLAAWTLRSQQDLDGAMGEGYRYPIFELFTPRR